MPWAQSQGGNGSLSCSLRGPSSCWGSTTHSSWTCQVSTRGHCSLCTPFPEFSVYSFDLTFQHTGQEFLRPQLLLLILFRSPFEQISSCATLNSLSPCARARGQELCTVHLYWERSAWTGNLSDLPTLIFPPFQTFSCLVLYLKLLTYLIEGIKLTPKCKSLMWEADIEARFPN